MTLQRTEYLSEDGKKCARIAKSKGKTINDSRGYNYLIGDNNTAAWKAGWDKEWRKMNVKSI